MNSIIFLKLFVTFGIFAVVFMALAALQDAFWGNKKADKILMLFCLSSFLLACLTAVAGVLTALWS